MPTLTSLARKVRDALRPRSIVFRGSILPAKHLRFGGTYFLDDDDFLGSGEKEAQRLARDCGLAKKSRLLEIGCGPGRLPIGILASVGEIALYHGVDVSAPPIRWCLHYIHRFHPSFRFTRLNLRNERYNRKGNDIDDAFRFPFAAESFDIVYLYSVFSHMTPHDIRQYLREFRRVLVPGGKMFLTAFVEEGGPDVSVNPDGYRRQWHGALHCVRFEKKFFEEMMKEYHFTIDHVDHATETDGQSAFVLTKI